MTMKIVNIERGQRATPPNWRGDYIFNKRDESAEAKPLDYVEPYRGANLVNVTHNEVPAGLASGFAIEAQLKHLETKIAKASEEYEKRSREQCEKLVDSLPSTKAIRAKLRYTGNNLEVEARIAKEMQYRDNFEKKMDEMEANVPIFHPTSLSAFVQDHRIMRKGPWK